MSVNILKPWFTRYERHSPDFARAAVTELEVDPSAPDVVAKVGGWFRIPARTPEDEQPRVLTPYHGRSAVVRDGDGAFIAVKGCGWTWPLPTIFRSTKDAQLTFGLLAERDARREFRVSQQANALPGTFARVLAVASLDRVHSVELDFPSVRWTDGELIRPCLLYTRQRSPIRVMDLVFLSDEELGHAIAHASEVMSWSESSYATSFAETLGSTIASLHHAGGVNDTLESGNVTLCAEVTDFEWMHLPPVDPPFPDDSSLRLGERRAKELIYGIEIVTFLAARLGGSGRAEQEALLSSYEAGGGPARDCARRLRLNVFA